MDNTKIKKAEIQRLVAFGLQADWVRHIVLRIESPPMAREFLKQIIIDEKLINDAGGNGNEDADPPPWKMNISFTYSGLQRLELNKQILEITFPTLARAFVQGASLRGQALGDVGVNSPENWETNFRPSNAHLVLTVYGQKNSLEWDKILEKLRNLSGVDGVCGWDDIHLGESRKDEVNEIDHIEVFGFRDGISQPYFRGVSKTPVSAIPESLKFEAGDLLLGYENSIRENFWDNEDDLLPEGTAEFFQNGSFAAYRKIEQDRVKFDEVTAKLAVDNEVDAEYVRAKLFGRWKNGAVVQPGQKSAPEEKPSEESINKFDFSNDPDGNGCPFGAHMRRINHRANEDVFPNRHRAIQRRGLPYGSGKEGEEEGLLGLFFCSSLEGQFEFVMGDWVEGSPRMHKGCRALNSDPVIGNQCNGDKGFYIPREDADTIELRGLRQFTTTKGMLYLFFPSMEALRRMALDPSEEKSAYFKQPNYKDKYVPGKEAS